MTPHAKAAKAIRLELKEKFPKIKFSVRGEAFSMGNAVRVTAFDISDQDFSEVRKIGKKYQYGHFDGMTDSYEHSNKDPDLPQVKYVTFQHRNEV